MEEAHKGQELKMEKVKGILELCKEDSENVSKIAVHPHRPHIEPSFYEDFAVRGIRVDRVEPGLVVCSFRVPPRLTVSPAWIWKKGLNNICLQIRAGILEVIIAFVVAFTMQDKSGNLAPGAIANLVDEVGASVIHREGLPMSVSVTMSISYVSTAKVNDELEVTSKLLGKKGFISGTVVSVKNKATGEAIAEGRHMLFSKPASKI